MNSPCSETTLMSHAHLVRSIPAKPKIERAFELVKSLGTHGSCQSIEGLLLRVQGKERKEKKKPLWECS